MGNPIAHVPEFPSWPGSPPPGRPQPPTGPEPGPVPPTRVWLDPNAGWQDTLYERLLEQRIVLASGVLDETAATRLSAQLLTLSDLPSGWAAASSGSFGSDGGVQLPACFTAADRSAQAAADATAAFAQNQQLPVLTNWQHWGKGEYVMGLEPGTHPPTGQARARREGTLIMLEPGESRHYELQLDVLHNPEKIRQFLTDLS